MRIGKFSRWGPYAAQPRTADRKRVCLMNAKDKCALVDNEHDLEEIVKANHKVIALLYASWCPFCARFLPLFERHAAGEGRKFLLIRDDRESMADKYGVEVVPTLLFFENGAISKRLEAVIRRASLVGWLSGREILVAQVFFP